METEKKISRMRKTFEQAVSASYSGNFSSPNAPLLVIAADRDSGTVEEKAKQFFDTVLAERKAVRYVSLEEESNTAECIAGETEWILGNAQFYSSVTKIRFCILVNCHDTSLDRLEEITGEINQVIPPFLTGEFYVFCRYGEMELNPERRRAGMEFLQNLEVFCENHPGMQFFTMGMEKQSGEVEGKEEREENQEKLILSLLCLIAEGGFRRPRDGSIYALGIACMSRYFDMLWDSVFGRIAAGLGTYDGEESQESFDLRWELQKILEKTEKEMNVEARCSRMRRALMLPVSLGELTRKNPEDVEKMAFGDSLSWHFARVEESVRRKVLDEDIGRLLTSLDRSQPGSREELRKKLQDVEDLEEKLAEPREARKYEQFSEVFGATQDTVRDFVLDNLYAPLFHNCGIAVEKEALDAVRRYLENKIQFMKEEKDRLRSRQEELRRYLSRHRGIEFYGDIPMEEALKRVRKSLDEGESDFIECICRETDDIVDIRFFSEVMKSGENIRRVLEDAKQKGRPYCVDMDGTGEEEKFFFYREGMESLGESWAKTLASECITAGIPGFGEAAMVTLKVIRPSKLKCTAW